MAGDWGAVAGAARLGLVVLAAVGLVVGNATSVALAGVFLGGSLVVWRVARPGLDAGLALLFLAHGWASLLCPAGDIEAWGPALHLVVPALVAVTIALVVADRRRSSGASALRPSRALVVIVALLGGLVVVGAWELLEHALNGLPGVAIAATGEAARPARPALTRATRPRA